MAHQGIHTWNVSQPVHTMQGMRQKRQAMLAGVFVALVTALTLLVLDDESNVLQTVLTYLLFGALVINILAFIPTLGLYRAWRTDWWRKKEAIKARNPRIRGGFETALPYDWQFYLLVRDPLGKDHKPPYTCTIHKGSQVIDKSRELTVHKGGHVGANWPDSFEGGHTKLRKGKYEAEFRDQGTFSYKLSFMVTRLGFLRERQPKHLYERLRHYVSMGRHYE